MDSAPQPQPQFLTSNPSKPFAVATILRNFASDVLESRPIELTDAHDTFLLHHFSDREKVLHEARESGQSTAHQSIIICTDGRLPEQHLTPSFDLGRYYQALSEARKGDEASDKQDAWSVGDVVLYGEVVASTQTMLAKYVVDCVGKKRTP